MLNTIRHSRGAMRPSCACSSRPNEGVGNAGCPMHPQPRVRNGSEHTSVVTTGPPEQPGIPAHNGFNGFLRALRGDRLVVTVACGLRLCQSGWIDNTSANLTPAPGRPDHTTSPSASAPFVNSRADRSRGSTRPAITSRAQRCCVHRIPFPTSVAIAIRPSWGRMG
jgi:hypothetical protein